MARVLAISSQVVRGHVGLSAIVPVLQAMGHDVVALPTVLLSNHPGHEHVAGERIAPDQLRCMFEALAANGWLADIDAVLTGYLPSAEHVHFAVAAIDTIRQVNRNVAVLVDPVLGDEPKGLYIEIGAARAVQRDLIPRAGIIKLNAFELGWLSGRIITDAPSAAAICQAMHWPATVVTSLTPEPGHLTNACLEAGKICATVAVERRAAVPNGTGDLFSGLLLGHILTGSWLTGSWLTGNRDIASAFERACAGMDLVVAESAGRPELELIANLQAIATASPKPNRRRGTAQRPCVAGVDACPAGWLVVLADCDGDLNPRARIVPTFADVLALPEGPRMIAIDIPIGLPERSGVGGRAADIAARANLGARQSSLFAVPARAAVMETDYRAACAAALRHSEPPRKVSKQTFNLFPKIREVDALMTPAVQARVFECHPETAFWVMNKRTPLDAPKKVKSSPNPAGLALRRTLLADAGFPSTFLEQTHFRRAKAGADDLLDACACAWTALRIGRGQALTFPDVPPLDARGLRQEIRA